MNTGVSITDLGLNDFRMDLVNYMKDNGDMDKVPFGLHAVVPADPDKGANPGIVFVLRNVNQAVNRNNQNRLHPFYLVYIGGDGDILSHHLDVKRTLDFLRSVCRGQAQPIREACEAFNRRTRDGRDMNECSQLLESTIRAIVYLKEESDLDSLFTVGKTTALTAIIAPYEGDAPRFHRGDWRTCFPHPGFGPLVEAHLPHEHAGPPGRVIVDRFLSVSFIAALPDAERAQVRARIEDLVAATHPALRGRETVRFPYTTMMYHCVRH